MGYNFFTKHLESWLQRSVDRVWLQDPNLSGRGLKLMKCDM